LHGLLLELLARDLDLVVLALDLAVLLGEQLGLVLEVGIGLLQLFLLLPQPLLGYLQRPGLLLEALVGRLQLELAIL